MPAFNTRIAGGLETAAALDSCCPTVIIHNDVSETANISKANKNIIYIYIYTHIYIYIYIYVCMYNFSYKTKNFGPQSTHENQIQIAHTHALK